MDDEEKPDPMYVLTGQAVVEWSKVELMWAYLFRDMLFDGIGVPPKIDQETGVRLPQEDDAAKRARANAVFFNAGGGDAQRKLIKSVAQIALANRTELLTKLTGLLTKSRTLAGKRNKIVHAFYDNRFTWPGGNTFEFGHIAVDDFGGARPKPDFSYEDAVGEFYRHANEVRDLWLEFHQLA